MDLATRLLLQIDDPALSPSEQAQFRCALAKELEESGNYDGARRALGELWQRIGEVPKINGLDERTAASVLLRAGTLSGWIGSAQQIAGSQEAAKDLISESIRLFESVGERAKAVEARTDLAVCYWREGALDEARIILREALGGLSDEDGDLKAIALLRSAIVERRANKLGEALDILTEGAPLFEASSNHSLKGNFHNTLATLLENLSRTERCEGYIDRALIEYAAASFHFEQAQHTRYQARVENNLGFLFFTLSRFDEAHRHLDCARRLFVNLKDKGSVAQVDETRARALLAEGRNADAEKVVQAAVHTLEKGGEQALLAEALTTQGVVFARLRHKGQARATLERAIAVAEQAGDLESAGRAALTLIEELGDQLGRDEVRMVYAKADHLLSDSQHTETLARLRRCASSIIALKSSTRPENVRAPFFVHAAEKTAGVVRYAQSVARTDRPVIISGETGTGKDVLARLMHEWSGRAGQFVTVNCAALGDTPIESHLFGHRKGSFTGALNDHPGAVEAAAGGTLFLDEVGELSPANQSKLLRFIEGGEVYSIGSQTPEQADVRIIAATTHDLRQEVARGCFRRDLFYRLGAFVVEIPPLRERPEDVPALAAHFIEQASPNHDKRVTFTPSSLEKMQSLTLRGNARELRTLIENALITASDGAEVSAEVVETLALRQTQKGDLTDAWAGCSLEEEVRLYEGSLIRRALDAAQGRLTHAARLLGVTHQGLAFILNGRHQALLGARRPVQRRRSHYMRSGRGAKVHEKSVSSQ